MKKLKGIIDRIEGESVVVRHNKKDIIIPIELVENPTEGEALTIWLMDSAEDTEKSSEIAQNLLKEILKED